MRFMNGAQAISAWVFWMMSLGMGVAAVAGFDDPPNAIAIEPPPAGQTVGYAETIADLLDGKCVACHNSLVAEGRLNLETYAGLLKGGKRGPSIVPGKADQSPLFLMGSHRMEPVMPPKEKAKDYPALTPAEVGLLKAWIDAGAIDDSDPDGETTKPAIELGTLPPGLNPVLALDFAPGHDLLAIGRANVVTIVEPRSGVEALTLGGHLDYVGAIRFSPDGSLLASGSYRTALLHRIPRLFRGPTLDGAANPPSRLIALPGNGQANHNVVAAVEPGGAIRVWSGDGQSRTLDPGGPPLDLAAAVWTTPAGRLQTLVLVGNENGVIRLLDLAEGNVWATLKGHNGPARAVAILHDDQGQPRGFVAGGDDGTLRFWNAPAFDFATPPAEPIAVEPSASLAGEQGAIRVLASAPGSRWLISGGADGTIRLRDPLDGQPQSELIRPFDGQPIRGLSLVATKAGALAVALGDAGEFAALLALPTPHSPTPCVPIVHRLDGHLVKVTAAALAEDGRRLVTTDEAGGVKLWSLDPERLLQDARLTTTNNAPASSAASLGEVPAIRGWMVWSHRAVSPEGRPTGPPSATTAATFLGDGRVAVAGTDNAVRLTEVQGDWEQFRVFEDHAGRVLALDFDPTGGLLAVGGGDPSRSGELVVWEVGKGMVVLRSEETHSDTVFAVRFSPDGRLLASGGADKFLKVTRLEDGKIIRSYEGHTHHVLGVDWKSDGRQLASSGGDSVVKVWSFDTGEQIRTCQAAGKQITALDWLPGGPLIAGASGDRQARLWNADNGQVTRGFGGSSEYLHCLAVGEEGGLIAAGADDGTVMVWKTDDAAVLRRLGDRR